MGVETRLVLFAPDSAAGLRAATAAFDRIAELDSLLSDYRVDSELNALNAAAGSDARIVSVDLARVLSAALEVSDRSGGAFDITIGPLVALWRAARESGRAPDAAALERAHSLVDWRWVRLDPATRIVRLIKPGMRLDLGAVGKGYAAGAARAVLVRHGIGSCLVSIGGEIALGLAPPGRPGWSIDIETGGGSRIFTLEAVVVATSGDTEQNVTIDGVRFSHVIEPASGRATSNGVGATVIGPDGARADALATAATLVDGRGLARLEADYPGYRFIVRSPGG
jgi:thiamine biosynthesis lipoprotein